MKRFQTLMMGISAIALVGAFANPTLAAKTVIEDEELDEVTAAGQPKVAQAQTLVGTARATNFQVNVFAAHIEGQEKLTALTLNNIFGENQVANGVNIQSGSANSGLQTNNIIQSWGSAKALGAVETASVAAGNGGDCFAAGLIAKCNGGDGGAGAAGKLGILWGFADEIADARSSDGPAISTNVVVTIVAGSFGELAQNNLTALTVNNIIGFNQVANGLNISAGSVTGANLDGAGSGTATGQSNVIEQWRGSPKNWEKAPTFF